MLGVRWKGISLNCRWSGDPPEVKKGMTHRRKQTRQRQARQVERILRAGGSHMQSAEFDYSAPAELFLAKPARLCRTKYRQFATAAEALRFAVEELRIPKAFGAWLEVGDQRFNSMEIQRLYQARPLHNVE